MSGKIHTHNGMKFRHSATGAWIFHERRHSKIRTPKKRKDQLKNNTLIPTIPEPKLTQSEKAIVQLLSDDETMTIQKLAEIRKCKERIIYRHLRTLKKKGVTFKYSIQRNTSPKQINPRHRHPLKPWKDPQSLFCSPRLKEIIKKEPAKASEIIAEE